MFGFTEIAPCGDLLDLLDQAVPVGGLPAEQVEHEEREDVPAADVPAEASDGRPLATGGRVYGST